MPAGVVKVSHKEKGDLPMPAVLEKNQTNQCEFDSGEIVEPGTYKDVDTGSVIHVHEADELPHGTKVVRYRRRFRRLDDSGNPCEE